MVAVGLLFLINFLARDFFDGIMEGYHTLVSIDVPRRGLLAKKDKLYSGVKGTFCHISWHLQEKDPSKVPMFKDLREKSFMCTGTLHTVDLYSVVEKARAYDQRNHTFAATNPKAGQGPVPPTAVIFHETRCGSTLLANDLAAFSPKQTRVFSESQPPVAALRACESRHCDPNAQEQLIRDVFYVMGRVTRPIRPQYAFYKIQSVGVRSIEVFTKAMPETPWIFAYRNSIEIMMSHFKNFQYGKEVPQDFSPVCLRTYGEPDQPPAIEAVVSRVGRTIDSLSKEEYCAAHLASLAGAAIDAHEQSKESKTAHWFVNYEQLPHVLWERILPKLTGYAVSEKQLDRIHTVSSYYSKGRGQRAGQHWHEDNTVKQGMAPESVKAAARLFLDPAFRKMEKIRADIFKLTH